MPTHTSGADLANPFRHPETGQFVTDDGSLDGPDAPWRKPRDGWGHEVGGHPDSQGNRLHEHEDAVTRAMDAGFPVPMEVLEDYPKLKRRVTDRRFDMGRDDYVKLAAQHGVPEDEARRSHRAATLTAVALRKPVPELIARDYAEDIQRLHSGLPVFSAADYWETVVSYGGEPRTREWVRFELERARQR